MRTKDSLTLVDVAKAAGVSASTVSRVLNKHPRINKNTRNKVYNIINELGYDTSGIERKAMAKAAKASRKVMHIEFVLYPLPEQNNILGISFFNAIFNSVQTVINQMDNVTYNICFWDNDNDINSKQNEDKYVKLIKSDGVLILGNPSEAFLKKLKKAGVKTVMISTGFENIPFDLVEPDNFNGGRMAARYLIEHGHKKISFIGSVDSVHEWALREDGALLECQKALGSSAFTSVKCANTEFIELSRVFVDWLEKVKLPQAIILPFADAIIPIEIILREKGLKCPQDISIVTFERPSQATSIKPVAIDIFPGMIGKKAALRLVQIIDPKNFDDTPHRVIIPVELIKGNSVMKCH